MVKYGMNVIAQATELVHSRQVAVLTVNQPLPVIAKIWPVRNLCMENKFVVMMGGLHIEMAFLKVLGDCLNCSGWERAMTTANITTDGRGIAIKKESFTASILRELLK